MKGRDTKFLGFAASLAAEIANTDRWMLVDVEKLIAQHAYDLVAHALSQVPLLIQIGENMQPRPQTVEDIIAHVPDMPELPEVSK